MAIRVGITGGIGSGKSVVGRVLQILGFPVYYSDYEAKQLMTEHKKLRQELISLFGEEAYRGSELNRSFLADQIFNHPELKEKMNALIHPKVRERFFEWVTEQNTPIVFNEAAILFETGSYKQFDYTVLVTAKKEIRLQRVKNRDGLTLEQVEARMKHQWSDEKKIPLADFVINNNPEDSLFLQLVELLSTIVKRENLDEALVPKIND